MYIAGIHLSHNQAVEALAASALAIHWARHLSSVTKALKIASQTAGPILSKPSTPFRRFVSGKAFMAATLGPPLALIGTVAYNGFVQPEWMQEWSLPDWCFDNFKQKAGVRTLGAVFLFLTAGRITSSTIAHLGSQISSIGVSFLLKRVRKFNLLMCL